MTRFVLAGSMNTRSYTTNALPASSGVVGSGVVGAMIVGLGSGASSKDQRFVNVIHEVVSNPLAKSAKVYVTPRP